MISMDLTYLDNPTKAATAIVLLLVGIVVFCFFVYLVTRVVTLAVMKTLQSFRNLPSVHKEN